MVAKVLEIVVLFSIMASLNYISSNVNADESTLCEEGKAKLSCDIETEVMDIVEATYGRLKPYCFHINPESNVNINCGVKNNVFKTVQDLCKGKNVCEFPVTNKFFGFDPCRGTFKYCQVEYKCHPPTRDYTEPANNVTSTATTLVN